MQINPIIRKGLAIGINIHLLTFDSMFDFHQIIILKIGKIK
jgi:hypothetical protein